jgi:two-component system, sensor histidine kinase and response regulator
MSSDSKVCDLPAALARMGGNVVLLKQFAEFCREDLPTYLGRLKTAVAEGNADAIRNAAHSIKGMVVNFDAAAAAAAAQRLEQLGLAKDLREAEIVSQTLEDEIGRLLTTLNVELAKL